MKKINKKVLKVVERVIRMAFNLYCDGMPSVKCTRQKIEECQNYSVSELFCCSYAPFFWQAIQLRYPEYVTYNKKLYAMLGGRD